MGIGRAEGEDRRVAAAEVRLYGRRGHVIQTASGFHLSVLLQYSFCLIAWTAVAAVVHHGEASLGGRCTGSWSAGRGPPQAGRGLRVGLRFAHFDGRG